MRIIGGKYKSVRFTIPKSFPSRPTTDFAKEGLFNILSNKNLKEQLAILDLCCGTGSISYEFLSHEMGSVVAVDQNYNCVKHIKNIALQLKCEDKIAVEKSDIFKYIEKTNQKFDLIFADPPFDFKDYNKIVVSVFKKHLLNEAGILILEHSKRVDLSNFDNFTNARNYGNITFSFFNQPE